MGRLTLIPSELVARIVALIVASKAREDSTPEAILYEARKYEDYLRGEDE